MSSTASSRLLWAGAADRVVDAACLQPLVDRRPREGRVGPERDPLVLGLLAVDLGHEQFRKELFCDEAAMNQLL
jgi:hypothetical protein